MKKSLVAGGLAGIVLACLPLSSQAQKRQYIQGNIHDIKYEQLTEKDFPKYKIKEDYMFDHGYTFWKHAKKEGELNFLVSKIEEESMDFQEGKQVEVNAPMYVPKRIYDKINITNMSIERTSIDKLKKRAKERDDIGFSVDITDKDLKFALPERVIEGVTYVVLHDVLNNSEGSVPFYLIPKTKGTKIYFLSTSFVEENNYEVQAVIECDEKGGVFQPVPFSGSGKLYVYNPSDYNSGIPEKQEELEKQKLEKQDISKKTNYMKYREELEKEQSKESKLEKQTQTQDTSTKKEEKQDSAVYHKIQKGDTFYTLADLYWGTSKEEDEIERLNPGVDPKHLKIGQKIRVK